VGVLDRFDLTGKTALVTGGSRGLGREMVLAFAECGADVIIVSRKLDSCEALAAEVRERFGRVALPVSCHVGRWDEIDRLVETVYAQVPKLDILVNNAGMSPLYGDRLADVTEDLWDKVHSVNLKGPFRLSALVGERMIEAGSGVILNISTTGAVHSYPAMLPYHAAKAGLNIITTAMAVAFGPKVRVNCIMPGGFLTDIATHWDMEAMERRSLPRLPLHRFGQPDEIVGAALFLVSDAGSYTTGTVFAVDGGSLASI
jgi:NAD(P)-dependent dehydrogenase (short-subunit alcohol dehydrogenase family)